MNRCKLLPGSDLKSSAGVNIPRRKKLKNGLVRVTFLTKLGSFVFELLKGADCKKNNVARELQAIHCTR
jgi:hypothetical protein